ncbi:MAG: hypothetical protein QOF68_830 [Gaiellales bacterium]|nr:hypothetical protein [Gaiellales bacterium]
MLLSLAVLVPAALVPSVPASATLQFGGTGLEGGGFQNVVAVDPFDSDVVLSGGDVAGFQRSTDGGVTWRSSNAGLSVRQQLAVASILFSPTTQGKVYAAVGDAGNSGGLLVSNDGGRSWTVRSTTPMFAGGNAKTAGMPAEHPRSTGNLLAEVGGRLYAATFKSGLMRSDDDGVTWTTLGLAGLHLRTLAADSLNFGVLYVGSYGQGAFRIDDSVAGLTVTPLGSSPRVIEELSMVGSTIFAAAGTAGLFRSDDGGGTWQHVGTGLAAGANWTSIVARQDCTASTTVLAGALGPGADDVVRSSDGGTTWGSLTAAPAAVKTTVGGPSGHPWWLASRSGFLLGGPMYAPAQIAFAPSSLCESPEVFVAGRSGLWGSRDDGGTWYPMVGRMGVSIAQTMAVDPANPRLVHIAATDWGYVGSSNGLDTVSAAAIPGAGPTAFDVAVDSASGPSRVYVTTGHRDSNTKGRVLSSSTPSVNSSWVDEKLPVAGKRALAIAVGRQGANRVVIAAVDAGGIWRKVGTAWKKVTTPAMAVRNPAKPIQLIWPTGTGTIYLYDHKTGIWRSTDYGLKWTKIWAKPSVGDLKGYIAANATGTQLWVSTGGSIYRLDGANSGTVGAGITPRLTLPWAGPVGFDHASGTVYVAEQATPGRAPALWASTDGGSSWEDVADDGYRAAALQVFDLVPDRTGGIWAALQGNGIIHGVPAS